MKIKILEVDQWTSSGNITSFTLEDFDLQKVKGGDSETIRRIGHGRFAFLEVEEEAAPPDARVWYRPGPDGKLVLWKHNYDSSG